MFYPPRERGVAPRVGTGSQGGWHTGTKGGSPGIAGGNFASQGFDICLRNSSGSFGREHILFTANYNDQQALRRFSERRVGFVGASQEASRYWVPKAGRVSNIL